VILGVGPKIPVGGEIPASIMDKYLSASLCRYASFQAIEQDR
jgi:hypothetical protein